MRILGIIPARGGSKGVPRKNIKMLGNKPLLQYTTEVALQSNLITNVIVSSDCDNIIALAQKLGASAPFKRPAELASDTAPTLPLIQHALHYFKQMGQEYDAVCLLQPTNPFRTPSFLDTAIKKFIKNNTDSLISVQEVPHEYNPHWVFEEKENGFLSIATGEKTIISRRQELPKAYHRDGSIYLTKTTVLLEQNSIFGNSISYLKSPSEFSINIDTMDDWEEAVKYVKTHGG